MHTATQNTLKTNKMTTITMTNSIEQGVQAMLTTHATACTEALAKKYGFDLEEALRELKLDNTKIKKEKAPKAAKSPKGEKSAKAEKPAKADKPKRKATGYLLFSADVRPATKAELEADLEEDEKLKPQATVSAIAAKWGELGEEGKAVWNAKAKELASSSDEE